MFMRSSFNGISITRVLTGSSVKPKAKYYDDSALNFVGLDPNDAAGKDDAQLTTLDYSKGPAGRADAEIEGRDSQLLRSGA